MGRTRCFVLVRRSRLLIVFGIFGSSIFVALCLLLPATVKAQWTTPDGSGEYQQYKHRKCRHRHEFAQRQIPSTMNKVFLASCIAVVFMCGSAFSKSWRNITPLSSTRSEVERVLGRPVLSSKHSATYHTNNEAVSIIYSNGLRCAVRANSEWNVPKNRVISITVAPKGIVLFSSLHLDETKYRKSADPHRLSAVEYTNVDEGESITVVNGEVSGFRYTADAASNHLRRSSNSVSHEPRNSWTIKPFLNLTGNRRL